MLDKLTVLEYEKPVADAYAEATRLLVENIAKHIASGRALNTAAWEVEKLKELGLLNRENAAIIRKVLLSVPDDVKYALSESAAGAFRDIMDAVSYAEFTGKETRPPEEINRQIIEAWLQTATDKFNLTNTTMLQSAQQAYITAVNGVAQLAVDTLSDAQGKAVYGAFNASTAGILAGGMTLDEAKKTVIGRMAQAGIYGFVDRAGRHWSPEAYASMVLRTTAHNVSVQATKAASQEFGVNVFQCSWHPNSRPTHYDYQGKFYSWDNSYGTFEDGLGVTHSYEPAANAGVDTAAGLFGINCGHEPIPMDEGVSVPFDPADIQPKELSDKGYAQAQEQRAKERAIRHAKMMANVYETAGDDKQAAEWRAKTREEQAALRRYLNETGRTRSRGREQIGGTAPTAKEKPTAPGGVFSAEHPLSEIAEAAKEAQIDYRPVELLQKRRTSEEIIASLAGADKTDGSCSSLAFAYAGQRAGYDVTDFRGGRSCDFFARVSRINLVEDFGTPIRAAEYNGFTAAHKVLEAVEEGKEYRLGVGKHAAIVRKVDGVLQYLELQSGWRENTWYTLDDAELKRRFGVQKSRTSYGTKLMQKASLTDISTLAGDQFRDILGYINTAEGEQKKGAGGGEK